MATVRLMSWNIQVLGPKKGAVNAIIETIARTIIDNEVDIFLVVELQSLDALKTLSAKLNSLYSLRPGATRAEYKGYFYSPKSPTKAHYSDTDSKHAEHYGLIVKDAHANKVFGFKGPLPSDKCYIKEYGTIPSQDHLAMTSGMTNNEYENALWLYDKKFPVGRPPCWVRFEQDLPSGSKLEFDLIAVHFRPDYRLAADQMKSIVKKFDRVQDKTRALIIAGDFNTENGMILDRVEVGDNVTQALAVECGAHHIFSTYDRESHSTHISGEVYDNFFARQTTTMIGSRALRYNGIVRPDDVIAHLRNIPNAENELLAHIGKRQNRGELTTIINNFFALNPLTQKEKLKLYGIISDHYPIMVEVART